MTFNLITADEIDALRAGIFARENGDFTVYVGSTVPDVSGHQWITWTEMARFITDAADFVYEIVK